MKGTPLAFPLVLLCSLNAWANDPIDKNAYYDALTAMAPEYATGVRVVDQDLEQRCRSYPWGAYLRSVVEDARVNAALIVGNVDAARSTAASFPCGAHASSPIDATATGQSQASTPAPTETTGHGN